MTIDEYLAELERRLPPMHRRRFLAEAEDHLHDAARANRQRGLDADAAVRAAIEGFGDVAVVVRRLASEAAVWETRIASALALGAAASFVPWVVSVCAGQRRAGRTAAATASCKTEHSCGDFS